MSLYVKYCGVHRDQLRAQLSVVKELQRVTTLVVNIPKKQASRRSTVAKEELLKIEVATKFWDLPQSKAYVQGSHCRKVQGDGFQTGAFVDRIPKF